MKALTDKQQKWIQNQIGTDSQIASIRKLPGSTSSDLYDLTIRHAGMTENVVLRLFTLKDWLEKEPDLALHEAHALEKAKSLRIPTPEILAYDETGISCGHPAILMTKLKGQGNLKPHDRKSWISQMALNLARIHESHEDDFQWEYFPYTDLSHIDIPDWSRHPDLWEKAFQIVKGAKPKTRNCLIHRDYHPANVLWENDQISGVVDWVNACLGPAGVDVGHCRVNLVMLFGVDIANEYLQAYQEVSGTQFRYELYYDLLSLSDFVLPGPPTVYQGWEAFGITHLTDNMMRERADQYLVDLMKNH